MKRGNKIQRGSFLLFLITVVILFQLINTGFCFGLKNPFISPFKVKQYRKHIENPLSGMILQAIVSSSSPDKNVAIINGKPYYIGSKVMGETIIGISPKAVIIKLANGKIAKLLLSRYEGSKK